MDMFTAVSDVKVNLAEFVNPIFATIAFSMGQISHVSFTGALSKHMFKRVDVVAF